MDKVEDFLKKSKRRLYANEHFQPHNVPRLNLHVASNSHSANSVVEDLLTSLRHKGYVSTFPIPIGPPVKVSDEIVKCLDPALKLVKDKQHFKAMYESVRQSRQIRDLTVEDIEHISEIAQTEPVVDVHPNILAFVQVCSLDPDPEFSCDYNYYYGGNLAAAELQGQKTVIFHSEQDQPSKLRVVVSDFDESNYDVSHVNHQMEDSPVYQVDSFSNLVLLRQMKSCGLFKFSFDEGISLEKMCICTTPGVFVSSTFNTFKQDEFATVSRSAGIEIHDVHGRSKRSVEVEGVKDNWGQVHYHDQNILMFTDRDSVSLCDLRESGSESLQWEVQNHTEICENVFAAAKGKFLHYICTKHHLLSLDIRKGFCQRWAHGLSSAPSLLATLPDENQNDGILIGCQLSGGIVYVQNSPFGDFTSDILFPPVRLPSPRETLHSARTKECLVSPIISSRFSLSLTGLSSLKRAEKIRIFSSNSVGDLFAQSICLKEQCDSFVEPLTGSDLAHLHHWESLCLQQYSQFKHDFNATGVASLNHIVGLFDDTGESSIDVPSTSQRITSPTLQPWNKSKKRLTSFQDTLAPKLLAHWNIEEEAEWCDADAETIDGTRMVEESSDEQEDVDAKVQKWLDKSLQQPASDKYW